MTVERFVGAIDAFLEADARRRSARVRRPLERRLEAAVARAFRAQARELLRRLAKGRRRLGLTERFARNEPLLEAIEDWIPIFDEAMLATVEVLEGAIRQYAGIAMLEGARAAIAELRIRDSFALAHPEAIAYLDEHVAARVAGINAATRDEIGRIITAGAAQGKSYSAIAREIRARFEQFSVGSPLEHIRSRAELVAVTEVGDAYEAGNRAIADRLVDAGLEMEKSWLDVGDGRVDPDCVSNAAEGWIPIGDSFPSGHDQPTAHPGCRCTVLYRRKGSAG